MKVLKFRVTAKNVSKIHILKKLYKMLGDECRMHFRKGFVFLYIGGFKIWKT